jgi:nitrogenase molybdenum-iron protein beta chain
MEKNFAREALVVNPAKACQPLGAVLPPSASKDPALRAWLAGCVAYYRSHFSRHFKEPTSCVSSSMTEDAAVFGGLNNMIDGLANTYNLYKPEMIAVSTTCMAEVIGDDLNAFIKTSRRRDRSRPSSTCPSPTPRPSSAATSPATTMPAGRPRIFLGRQGGHHEPLTRVPNDHQLHRRL